MVRYKIVATIKSLIGKCPNGNRMGDKIEIARGQVTGVKCPDAFNSIYPTIFAMRYGAELPWLKDKNVAIARYCKLICHDFFANIEPSFV